MSCAEMKPLIEGYFDQELDLVRSLEIEKHMEACAACAEHLKHLEALRTTLHAARLHEAAPERLRRWAESLSEPRPKKMPVFQWDLFNRWGALGVAAFAGAALLISVPMLSRVTNDQRLAEEVVSAHVRSLMANHLMDVQTSNQHVVKPWFNGRLNFSPTVKDFSDHGFPLAGGRLDYIAGHSVAAIVYRRALHPINLFIWPTGGPVSAPPKTLERQGYHLLHWSEKGMTFWVVSDLNPNELQDFAELVQSAS